MPETATSLVVKYERIQRERLRAAEEFRKVFHAQVSAFAKSAAVGKKLADGLADKLDELGVLTPQNEYADPADLAADDVVELVDTYIEELESIIDELPEVALDAKEADEEEDEDDDEVDEEE